LTPRDEPVDEPLSLPGLPFALRWQLAPERWGVAADGSLSITAGAVTDLFVDPQGGAPVLNAPRLLASPTGDHQLSARVTVDFAATFDAGVLLLYAHERAWAKLCFERSPRGEPMVVSVVTRGVSDDADSFVVDGPRVWLRVSRLGAAHAFHASTDGSRWRFVRHFALEPADGLRAGFLAQSPTGAGCTAVFDRVDYRPERLADLRNGT
jgi:regulation of enolase protein 1 (concanavalin A-like superfamily)